MSDTPDQEVGEEAAAYEPSPDDYFQAKEAGFSDPQAQFLLRRFGQPGPDPTTIAILTQIQARLDQQQQTNLEILTRLNRLEGQREADREQYSRDREQYEHDRATDRELYLRDRETDREQYLRDREQYERDREADREQYLREREVDREQYLRDREADRLERQRDRETDRLERQRDREEFLRRFAELREDNQALSKRLLAVETGLAELRSDVNHLSERTLFENRVWRAVVGVAVAAGAVIGGVLAFWR